MFLNTTCRDYDDDVTASSCKVRFPLYLRLG